MENSAIHILLPVCNRKNITQNFIECLLAQSFKNYHLIVIDDGSTDGTSFMVSKIIPSATIIKGDGKLWWAGALQKGYEYLKLKYNNANDYVLIANDDTNFESSFLKNGINILNNNPNTLLQAIIKDNKGNIVSGGVNVCWKSLTFNNTVKSEDINCLSTRNLLLPLKSFLQDGGFYPTLLPHYLSDYEFTMRYYKKGYRLIVDDSFFIIQNDLISETNIYKDIFKFIKHTLTPKYNMNPFYFSNFIVLCCPWKYKIVNIFRIWKLYFITLLKYKNYKTT